MPKALVIRTYNAVKSGQAYTFTTEVCIADDQGDSQLMVLELDRPTFAEPQSERKNAIRSAVIQKAYQDLELVVDEVLFEDFTT